MVVVNLVQLQENLDKVTYPLSKQQLLMYAEEKGIDEVILRALKQLPSKKYETLADISEALNESHLSSHPIQTTQSGASATN